MESLVRKLKKTMNEMAKILCENNTAKIVIRIFVAIFAMKRIAKSDAYSNPKYKTR